MPLSALRRAQHAAISSLSLTGTVLDVGGDPRSPYNRIIGGDRKVFYANINPAYNPDLVFDVQKPWPVRPSTYDAVLMFNLLEHVLDHEAALEGAYLALKSGGRLIGSVPFMYYVHGSPSDYYRYTRFALEALLHRAGFVGITVQELGSGAFSVAAETISGQLGLLAPFVQALARSLDGFARWLKPSNSLGPANYPLGYHFEAIRL